MSWIPLLEGEGDEDEDDGRLPAPPTDPVLPPPLGSPLAQDISFLPSTSSPSEGCGRPLTAPPGDRTRGLPRQRPSRREGLGRPMSATPSDKSFGMQRFRPGKSEGFGRPVTALPSDHSESGSPAWGLRSPSGFRCDESAEVVRPATAPAFAASFRLHSSGRSSSRDKRLRQNLNGVVPPRLAEEVVDGGGFEHGSGVRDRLGGSPGTQWAWHRMGRRYDG